MGRTGIVGRRARDETIELVRSTIKERQGSSTKVFCDSRIHAQPYATVITNVACKTQAQMNPHRGFQLLAIGNQKVLQHRA